MRLKILSSFLLCSITTIAQPYKNLVMEGGGIRGIAYAGAIQVLEEKKLSSTIENVAGTSVGALVGALYSVGYTPSELKVILDDLKIQNFNDGKWFFIGGQKRLRKRYGWYRGEQLEKWLGELIKQKTGNANTTFSQLAKLQANNAAYKNLHIVATNLSKQRMEVFSAITSPNLPIKTAVRASISIPMYFGAVFIDSNGVVAKEPVKGNMYNVYVDGGILGNYPLQIFDSGSANMQTLGLKLERPEQIDYYDNSGDIAPYNIDDFRTYINALYNVVIEGLNRNIPFEQEKQRTIYISTGNISPRVRTINMSQKSILYNNGASAVKEFLEAKGKSVK
jgi:NTE family protein